AGRGAAGSDRRRPGRVAPGLPAPARPGPRGNAHPGRGDRGDGDARTGAARPADAPPARPCPAVAGRLAVPAARRPAQRQEVAAPAPRPATLVAPAVTRGRQPQRQSLVPAAPHAPPQRPPGPDRLALPGRPADPSLAG